MSATTDRWPEEASDTESPEVEEKDTIDMSDVPVIPTIGGIRIGSLESCRQRYKSTGVVTAPRALANQFESHPEILEQYMTFLKAST